MFVLAVVKDSLKIHPSQLGLSRSDALKSEINRKYANRVLHKVGLCICFFDIVEAGEGFLYHTDGCAHVRAVFRLVVFRPFVGEVLVGKILGSTTAGVKVSLGFFDDILIPAELLQPNTKFNHDEQLFVWDFEGNELYMDLEEAIRFRVMDEAFVEAIPVSTAEEKSRILGISQPTEADTIPSAAPYTLVGSIQEDGLGLLSWWST